MAAGLFAGSVGRRLVQYAMAGTAGNLIVKGATRLRPHVAPAARRAAVKAVAGGIVGGRRLGDVAEEARLQADDVLAEARASLGEPAPAPAESAAARRATKQTTVASKGTSGKTTPARRKAAPRRNVKSEPGHEH